MLEKILTLIFGSKRERDVKKLFPLVEAVNAREEWARALGDADFVAKTAELRARYAGGEGLDSLQSEAFALAREAARRRLGERPYDVQVMGAFVLHQGSIVEMKTGEGKTLMSVAAAYLNALSGKGVHVVTVNDYLAERDAAWMRPVFDCLGMSVGVILSDMDNARRKENYLCDITYGTNNEFGFDYLRDNMHVRLDERVQRGHNFCIVDEIDSILIDEARTPLIISGAAEDDTFKFAEVDKLLGTLREAEKKEDGDYPDEAQGEEILGDYKLNEKNKNVSFTNAGLAKIEGLLQKRNLITGQIVDEENFEYLHYFTQALRSHKLFHIDVDYVVQDGEVQIVDEFTGRILYGRRYSDGLHQAIEAKEHIRIKQRNRTLATITFQNYFRLYDKISGMTGTADTEAVEFSKIYNLDVVVIPTNVAVARRDEDDVVYLDEEDKFQALGDEIAEAHRRGQPMLVGTVSIEKSEKLSALLTRRGVRHEVLNAKNHAREALIISEAGSKGAVTIATNMAGRGTDIKLGGNAEHRARRRAGTEAPPEKYREILAEELEKWKKDYEEVKGTGGLYVIGTERHESRRIDNQLRGRSGRQGDPGRSKFFISMDDELMRLFGGEKMKALMRRIGMEKGDPLYHPMLNRSIERAQKKVEERNFEIRKHLLEYDDVLNQQRKFIYEQRDAILVDDDLKARVNEATEDMVGGAISQYADALRKDVDGAYAGLSDYLKSKFNFSLPLDAVKAKTPEQIEAEVAAALKKDIDDKEALLGSANLNSFIRMQYLQFVDRLWLDHLENMEGLREAVYLRHYAQKNPLTEYKLEGFQIFDTMVDSIRQTIASRVHLVRIQLAGERESRSRSVGQATHGSLGAFAATAAASAPPQDGGAGYGQRAAAGARSQGAAPAATVVRTQPKVGRNDPCPCGSGKKYKLCHGR
ncbi:MAG: preprotein translocase subunit SecA [Spirochaetaceae bacterium]|jgi:preprotein translocase subunit SecA|nr:preprotein translocase subunit SecA [Spirochaetaceae bacterium]